MGGGGSIGGGGTTQSVSNAYSSLSPWIAPYVTSMLGAGQQQVFNTDPTTGQITGMNPYQAFGSANSQGGQYGLSPNNLAAAQSSVAGFSPLQQQSFQGASNLQTPGQYGTATNLANTAGMGALGTTGQAGMYGGMGAQAGQQGAALSNTYGGMGAMQGQQGANIGASLGQMSTSPGALQAYMNPYIQNALNPALQTLNQQYGIAGQQAAGQATSSGAFGGSRNALQQNLNAQNQMLAQNQLVGGTYMQAANEATAQMNAANQAALAGNQQALTGYGMGLQGAGQAGNLGIAGAQAGLQGIGAQQAGYGLAGQQAANLANIGTNQLAGQQNIINQQNQLGQQGTAQQQAIINQAMQNYQTGQQYPMTQLTNLKNLLSGVPITDTTQTIQQAAPSTANLIGGAGMTLLGAGLAGSGGSNVTINNPAPKSAQVAS